VDEVRRRIGQLEIEKQGLMKEKDEASRARLGQVEKELAALNEQFAGLKARWENEKKAIQEVAAAKAEIDKLKSDQAAAERAADFNRAAEIKFGRLPELSRRVEEQQAKLAELQKGGAMLKEEVTPEEIAEVVSNWTGIPVTRLIEGEVEKLLEMEERLARRVVGQEEAIRAVSAAVRRARSGLQDPHRPIGSFIFLGPTGVGKTETARALAEFLFDDEAAMERFLRDVVSPEWNLELDRGRTFADGIATRGPYAMTYGALREGLAGFVTVSEAEIAEALRTLVRTAHNLVEGAAAAGLAGLVRLRDELAGQRVAVVLTGSNIDYDTLSRVLRREL